MANPIVLKLNYFSQRDRGGEREIKRERSQKEREDGSARLASMFYECKGKKEGEREEQRYEWVGDLGRGVSWGSGGMTGRGRREKGIFYNYFVL